MKLRFYIVFLVIYLLGLQIGKSQNNIPPNLDAVGDQFYCPGSPINVVTDFDIVDPDNTGIESLSIQISTGYIVGQDQLTLIGSHPNILTSWNETKGKLKLSGVGGTDVLYTDLIAAVKDVVFQSSSSSFTGEKYFSFTIGDANYLPSTDHYYEYVPSLGITWYDAKAAAAGRTYYGLQGYLATIGSPEEAQLSGEQAGGAGWLGGTDEQTEGTWKWVTGPEAGTIFWTGGKYGSAPAGQYANWNHDEPNDCCNDNVPQEENYIHIYINNMNPDDQANGKWNDLPNQGGGGIYYPQGYIVEYGGMPGDPIVDISASTKISVPSIESTVDGLSCGPGTVALEAYSSSGTVMWFNVPTGGSPIASGTTYNTPVLNSTTTYYALASANGCLEGERIAVTATVYDVPQIQTSLVLRNCDEDGTPDGYTDFNLNESNDFIANGNTSGLQFSYYLSYTEAETKTNEVSPVPFNNSTSNTVYVRVENSDGCYQVATLNLQVSTTSFPSGYFQEMESCDDDNTIDGLHVFDLTQASSQFISQFPTGQNLSVHYYKNLADAQLEQNEITSQTNYVNEIPFSETLYVRVESEDNGDCFGIGPNLRLTVHPRPEFEVDQSDIYCLDNQPITLYTFNASGNFSYQWKDDNGNVVSSLSTLTITEGGTYSVIATSSFGCESFPHLFTVEQSQLANITLDDISVVEISDNNSITIDTANLGIGDYEFALDNSSGPYQDEPYFDHLIAGKHTLFVQDKNGCGVAQLDIFILGFPKFFTPNGDGYNDTWNIEGLSYDYTPDSKVYIFDRYGKLLKEINPRGAGWNGFFGGEKLRTSDYWFVAELYNVNGNMTTYRGHFSLVR